MKMADNIRNMTDHGLADYFYKLGACPPDAAGECCKSDQSCKSCWYRYLMKEKRVK